MPTTLPLGTKASLPGVDSSDRASTAIERWSSSSQSRPGGTVTSKMRVLAESPW